MRETKLGSHTDIARDPGDKTFTRRGTPNPLPESHPLNNGAMKDGLKHDWSPKAKAQLLKAMGVKETDETIGSELNE
jgi:hypothetical protein